MTAPAGKLAFIQSNRPDLTDGDYTIHVQHTFTAGENNTITPEVKQSFTVIGPRFMLNPSSIRSVFPPKSSLGMYDAVLPHIILNSATLPWQRSAQHGVQNGPPWLMVLVFNDAEAPQIQNVSLSSLKEPTSTSPFWPGFTQESGDDLSEMVSVIDVSYDVLQPILPTVRDLPYLAHVRQSYDDNGETEGTAKAVVAANRLPLSPGKSVVHLVSLENRYAVGSDIFNFQGAQSGDHIRLASLYHWSFTSYDPKYNFTGVLQNLNSTPSALSMPSNANQTAENFLQAGNVPLPHHLRTGDQSVCWYHGPLRPYASTERLTIPAPCSDSLLRFYKTIGMMDTGYAAAWELGRLLTLANKKVSLALYHYKQSHVLQGKQAEQAALVSHLLPDANHPPAETESLALPKIVQDFFTGLQLLKPVPFIYMVPDQDMLPVESIRFFQLDNAWVNALLDGAFSVGYVSAFKPTHIKTLFSGTYSGLLIRSEVVSGFPDLEVTAYANVPTANGDGNDQAPLTCLRMDRLSANVLFCLFDGSVKMADVHLKIEALHFGLDSSSNAQHTQFSKTLRNQSGKQFDKIIKNIPWMDNNSSNRVIDISQLTTDIKSELGVNNGFTSAEFALQMVEGVPSAQFSFQPVQQNSSVTLGSGNFPGSKAT